MFTTDGVTRSSTGASDGSCSPSIEAGIAPGTACAAMIRRAAVKNLIFHLEKRCTMSSLGVILLAIWSKTGYIAIKVKQQHYILCH
jgi:hypothetical protein